MALSLNAIYDSVALSFLNISFTFDPSLYRAGIKNSFLEFIVTINRTIMSKKLKKFFKLIVL